MRNKDEFQNMSHAVTMFLLFCSKATAASDSSSGKGLGPPLDFWAGRLQLATVKYGGNNWPAWPPPSLPHVPSQHQQCSAPMGIHVPVYQLGTKVGYMVPAQHQWVYQLGTTPLTGHRLGNRCRPARHHMLTTDIERSMVGDFSSLFFFLQKIAHCLIMIVISIL